MLWTPGCSAWQTDGEGQASFGTPEEGATLPGLASPGVFRGAAEEKMPLPMMHDPPWANPSAYAHAPVMPISDGDALEMLETFRRQSPQIQAHSKANTAVDTAALDAAPTAPMPSSQAHRLALEHTYIQGDENRVCGLLEDLRKVRALSASPRLCHPSHQVLETAKELNRVRFWHGDDQDRLTTSIQAVQLGRLTNVLNPDWISPGGLQYSPATAMAAAAQCCRKVVGAPPMQMWLSSIGRTVEIDRIVDVCARFRGPPCTITSPNAKPSGCQMLTDHFDCLNNCRMQLMRQMSQAPKSDVGEMEACLSALHNEHTSLLALVIYSNSRLIGPWRHQWQPPYSLGPQMPAVWESLNLTPEQRWQLFSMRERARDIMVAAKSAHSCSLDMATDLASAVPSALVDSVADNITLLDMVEASEQAKFVIPATEVMVAQAAFCNLLSPLQSARLMVSIRMLYTSIPGLRYEGNNFLRFAAACFLDEELGAWLDDTLPPSWWPDS